MARFLMQVRYDGTGFHGWQVQRGRRSVQGVLNSALQYIDPASQGVTGSGRTDAGVHALAQFAHFDFSGNMSPKQLQHAINTHLDRDVQVTGVWSVGNEFHARFQAYERSYVYLLAKERTPFNRFYQGYLPRRKLYADRMAELSQVLKGRHDFSSLSKDNPDIPNHVCDLIQLDITERTGHIRFSFTADRFLHNMVRRIVGTLINLAHQDFAGEYLLRILDEKDARQKLVITAPAEGLYLTCVRYPQLQLDETPLPEDW